MDAEPSDRSEAPWRRPRQGIRVLLTADEIIKETVEKTLKELEVCETFVQIYHPEIGNDPLPMIQLACAICLDKPIIVWCPPGREVPRKLRMIADKVVSGPIEEVGNQIKAFVEAWAEPTDDESPPLPPEPGESSL